jgi:hypothetical protein
MRPLLAIDPSMDEPDGPLVVVHCYYDWDWVASAADFDRAVLKGIPTLSAI